MQNLKGINVKNIKLLILSFIVLFGFTTQLNALDNTDCNKSASQFQRLLINTVDGNNSQIVSYNQVTLREGFNVASSTNSNVQGMYLALITWQKLSKKVEFFSFRFTSIKMDLADFKNSLLDNISKAADFVTLYM